MEHQSGCSGDAKWDENTMKRVAFDIVSQPDAVCEDVHFYTGKPVMLRLSNLLLSGELTKLQASYTTSVMIPTIS